MAFNGSANFPPGTVIKYFESIGLRFGQHQNAFTSFDQTTYQISLPDVKPATINKGLLFLADVAHRLLLPNDQLDRERLVVLEEARARKGAEQRVFEKSFPLLAPGARITERLPIGKEDVIQCASRALLESYYTKWYRPDNATLMVVGDLDAGEIEKLVAQNFADWKAGGEKPQNADPGIKSYTALRAGLVSDPELTKAEVEFYKAGPFLPLKTIGDFRRRVIEDLGSWIVDRRLAALVEKGAAPFQSAGVSVFSFLNSCHLALAEAKGQPEQWQAILRTVDEEVKRAREFGFLEQELADAKEAKLASAEQAAKTESTQDTHTFLGRLNNAVSQDQKPLSDAQQLELLKALLPELTSAEISAAFKQNFAPETGFWLLTLPEKPSAAEILAQAKQAEGSLVAAPAARQRPKSLLEKEPQPGAVENQEEDAALGILSATLSNGVRVHLRQMGFKKDEVLLKITVGGAELRETEQNRGISQAAALALSQPAAKTLSSTLIREILTGKNVQTSGQAGPDAFSFHIKTSTQDVEEGFREAYLLLSSAKVEGPALKKWREEVKQWLEEMKNNPEAQLEEHFENLLMNGDPRGKTLTPEQVDQITLPAAQEWLDDNLKNGPIEVSIVGDLDREKMLALALKYLGAPPKRVSSGAALESLRQLKLSNGPQMETVAVETITPRAVVRCGWRGANWKDVKERRGLELASRIMTSRLIKEIRQDRGLTYSIHCSSIPAATYEGTGWIAAGFTADPAKAEEACKLTGTLMEQFASSGPTDEEVETVHKQIRNDLETRLKEPEYWSSILSDLDYHGTKLKDVQEVLEKMTTYSKADLLDVLKKYVSNKGRIGVIATPKNAERTPAPGCAPCEQK
jgi:zinc protease